MSKFFLTVLCYVLSYICGLLTNFIFGIMIFMALYGAVTFMTKVDDVLGD